MENTTLTIKVSILNLRNNHKAYSFHSAQNSYFAIVLETDILEHMFGGNRNPFRAVGGSSRLQVTWSVQ